MEERVERKGRRRGCLLAALGCAGVVVLAALVLFAVFTVNNRTPAIRIPTPKMPKPNAWDDFVRASMMIKVPGPVSSTRPQSSWTDAEYEHFMREDAPALAAFRAALPKPYRHPVIRSVMAAPFQDYTRLRELARTLLSESMYYERRGDYGRAVTSRLDCIEFGAILPRGGERVAGLISLAIEGIGADKIGRILPKLTAAQLTDAATRMTRIQSRKTECAEVFREEGHVAAALAQQVLHNSNLRRKLRDPMSWLRETDPFQFYSDPFGIPKPAKVSRAGRMWDNVSFGLGSKAKMANEIRDYWTEVAAHVSKPYTGKIAVTPPDSFLAQFVFAQTFAPKISIGFAGRDAVLALIEIEIALRRYRADHGAYPARLAQLVPAYLKKVQRDPFGGKPLRYKVLKGGAEFSLYSVGENLADDGGQGKQSVYAAAAKDIVLDRK